MFPGGVPGRIVEAWFDARFDVVSSREQLEEVARVLAYRKIRRILGWDDRRIELFVEGLYLNTVMMQLEPATFAGLRDDSDLPILSALVSSAADVLVTGDQDLLVLRNKYPIETPAEFLRRL